MSATKTPSQPNDEKSFGACRNCRRRRFASGWIFLEFLGTYALSLLLVAGFCEDTVARAGAGFSRSRNHRVIASFRDGRSSQPGRGSVTSRYRIKSSPNEMLAKINNKFVNEPAFKWSA
jgi:hypothetical protein